MNLETILFSNENRGLFDTAPVTCYRIYTDDDQKNFKATFTDLKKAYEYVENYLRFTKSYIVRENAEIIHVHEKRGWEK
jgi:hypothetical protein